MHSGTGNAAAPTMPWHVMRNGTTSQYTRGRADEVAVYGAALPADTIRAHFEAGRDVTDTVAPAAPAGLTATARLGRVELDWSDVADPDVDGYDVFRATSAAGPFTRVNPSRLSGSAYTDAGVNGGTAYFYAVTASDEANNRSPLSATASATPPSTDALLRAYSPLLRYEAQETYFADSAAELTDNYVAGSRQNYLVNGNGTRLAAANPADPLANLSLAFLGDPTYADGRTATTSDYLDAANTFYQQDAQRMRAAGYGDRVYGRALTSGGKTWLQYWLFSYYNPQNVLGFGVHEGDWEFVQVGLDADGVPDVATYAQHGGGERCAWSSGAEVGRRAGRVRRPRLARLVLLARRQPARVLSRRLSPRHRLPGPAGARDRQPDHAVHGLAGQVGRVVVEPRRAAAPEQVERAHSFNSGASSCTVGAAQANATASALRAGAAVDEPQIDVTREGGLASVRYRFDARPSTLVVSVAQAGVPDVATARRVRVSREGVVELRLPPGSAGPYEVSASAFSDRGARSPIARARLR